MSAPATTHTELALQRKVDEREAVTRLHDELIRTIEKREDPNPNEAEKVQINNYRERATALDAEITEDLDAVEANRTAIETSKKVRRSLAGTAAGVEEQDGAIVYKDMATYARDFILTRNTPTAARIQRQVDPVEIQKATERLSLLTRTLDPTLSSDVLGLQPPQHIAQIMQVIDTSRPIVASATRDSLIRGHLTYPRVDTRPEVTIQNTEKQPAGDRGMEISMVDATASVYLGGGNISWQAVNWSTPNALDTWFRLAAAEYALKTETDAANELEYEAHQHRITTRLTSTPTFAQFLTAVGAGYSKVYADSGRLANTIYLAPDRFGYLIGMTSDAFAQFMTVSPGGVGPLNVVVSRGLSSGVIAVGDSNALLVAETAGAPVDLQVTEPAIGGYEVGLIGGFEAVVTDDGSFSLLTTSS